MVNLIGNQDQSVNDDICQQNADKLCPFKLQAAQLNWHVSLNILRFWCISSFRIRILWCRYKSVKQIKNNFQPINVNRKLAKMKWFLKQFYGILEGCSIICHAWFVAHHWQEVGGWALPSFNEHFLWMLLEVCALPVSLVSSFHCKDFFLPCGYL